MIGTPVFAAVVLLAFVGSYVALCVFRPAAKVLRLMDSAGELKHHKGDVPLVGGLAILAGYLVALAIHPVFLEPNKAFLFASLLLVITGTLDDRFLLHPVLRLAVQVLVALAAVFGAGLAVETIGAPFATGQIELGWLAIPFAVLVLVGGINAWNMIDGIDGLASVQAFIALSLLLIVAGSSTPALQASLLALLCSIAAFFLFNLPLPGLQRNRTFLGDAGSMFLGLAIVWHALALSQGEAAVISPITALWFVALPVFDVITTTLRRVLKGHSPLAGDRQHLHHLLQDFGLSIAQTLAVLSILSIAAGAFGLYGHMLDMPDGVMFASFGFVGGVYFFAVRRLSKTLQRRLTDGQAELPDDGSSDRVKVSVITVCFNSAETIADTIDSIRRQKHPDVEYIIIDGGSTDETLSIISKNRDVVSVLVTEPDDGMYHAANKGIKAASGDVVGMLNADDYYADDDVLADVARAVANGSDAVYGDLHYVDRINPAKTIRNWVSGSYERRSFDYGWMPPHPTFFLRRTAYQKYGLFRLDFESAADYELMLRMLYKHLLEPRYLNRVLVKMRTGGKSNVTLKNRIRANKEDRKAWRVNGLQAAWYTLYLKPLTKLAQYVR